MTYRDHRMTCPRCGVELHRRTHRETWSCRTCRGAAVEDASLVRRIYHLAPELVPDIATTTRPGHALLCPACRKPMSPVALRGVAIDRCYQDQLLWFDATELDRVLDAVLEDQDAQRGWLERLRDLLFAN
jgi:Zn-finger nucleic acid-binding protein